MEKIVTGLRGAGSAALVCLVVCGLPMGARAQDDVRVYKDGLGDGWANWSWAKVDIGSREVVHSGKVAAKVTCEGANSGFYMRSGPLDTSLYTKLTFWIHGGTTGGQKLTISGVINNTGGAKIPLDSFIAGGGVAAGMWRQVTIPLAEIGLGKTTAMTGFWIQDGSGKGQPTFYLDDITLVGKHAPPAPQSVKIDFQANRHPISPLIYGVAYAKPEQLVELNATLNRWGGNAATCYNWEQNASNRASDWFFESIGDSSIQPSGSADKFIHTTFGAKAQPMLTIPTLGWVAKLGPGRSKTWSFSQKKYGTQKSAEGDAGNGVLASGKDVAGNDPNDANVPADSNFEQRWVRHIVEAFGTASKGGLRYYILDNEPAIWYNTHRDVHPVGPKMEEISSKIIDYAAKIRAVDPGAKLIGPEEWGWSGYLYSGFDMQYGTKHGWNNLPDRTAHNNRDMMPWLLDELHKHDVKNKTRSLDIFSVHYYPQGGEYGNDASPSMQMRRNRSTRSLWDPNYTDESWVANKVQLIPRMKEWVKTNYPGLQTAITEYNWGAEYNINGGTTEADILGIFGREGLDMATYWTVPPTGAPTYKAIKMYRNVDGSNHGFGDISVSDIASDPDIVSSFAAIRTSDGAQTIMVINKSTKSPRFTMKIANCQAKGPMETWQLTSENTIKKLPEATLPPATGGIITFSPTLPPQSITLYVIPSNTSKPSNVAGIGG